MGKGKLTVVDETYYKALNFFQRKYDINRPDILILFDMGVSTYYRIKNNNGSINSKLASRLEKIYSNIKRDRMNTKKINIVKSKGIYLDYKRLSNFSIKKMSGNRCFEVDNGKCIKVLHLRYNGLLHFKNQLFELGDYFFNGDSDQMDLVLRSLK